MVCLICGKAVQSLSEALQGVLVDGSGEVSVKFLHGSRNGPEEFGGHIHEECFENVRGRFFEK